jgi:hypothetical protein
VSTYWGYRCLTCRETSEMHWNHGQEILRKLTLYAYSLRGFYELAGYVDLVVHSRNPDENPVEWLLFHEGHALVLCNEYGETEPI